MNFCVAEIQKTECLEQGWWSFFLPTALHKRAPWKTQKNKAELQSELPKRTSYVLLKNIKIACHVLDVVLSQWIAEECTSEFLKRGVGDTQGAGLLLLSEMWR